MPPKTYHTIFNPNEYPVLNISIKLPSALLDRGKILDIHEGGAGFKLALDQITIGQYEKHFLEQNVPYYINIYNFKETQKITIKPNGKCALYIMEGSYIAHFDGQTSKKALSESDVIILNQTISLHLESINCNGFIYMVTLKA